MWGHILTTSLDTILGLTSSLNVSNEHVHRTPDPLWPGDRGGKQSEGLPCPNGGWIKGSCVEHGTERWIRLSCKRRTCIVCREVRRLEIAARVSYGMERLGGEGKLGGAGWMVFTLDQEMTKERVNRISNQMVQWVKRYMKRHFALEIEWTKVWEIQHSGRLHLNLLVSPWRYIPQQLLARKWHTFGGGIVTWVKRVGRGLGSLARASRYKCALYFGKYDQMVPSGKGITYSKGWPKKPRNHGERLGLIKWEFVGNVSELGILHWLEHEMGHWQEVAFNEYAANPGPELCECFAFRPSPAQIAARLMKKYKRDGP